MLFICVQTIRRWEIFLRDFYRGIVCTLRFKNNFDLKYKINKYGRESYFNVYGSVELNSGSTLIRDLKQWRDSKFDILESFCYETTILFYN
jgi:hypothetical protein